MQYSSSFIYIGGQSIWEFCFYYNAKEVAVTTLFKIYWRCKALSYSYFDLH